LDAAGLAEPICRRKRSRRREGRRAPGLIDARRNALPRRGLDGEWLRRLGVPGGSLERHRPRRDLAAPGLSRSAVAARCLRLAHALPL